MHKINWGCKIPGTFKVPLELMGINREKNGFEKNFSGNVQPHHSVS